jgi:host factor-I protein
LPPGCSSVRNSLIFALESPEKPLHTWRRPSWAVTSGHEEQDQRRDSEALEKQGKKAMAADKQNLQDAFLNHVRKAKVPVTIFLINGVKLQGVITWFDNFCVLLRRDGQSQLVYKHAISTIMPGAPISLYEGED